MPIRYLRGKMWKLGNPGRPHNITELLTSDVLGILLRELILEERVAVAHALRLCCPNVFLKVKS